MRLPIFEIFDDQALVCFTGKLNILSKDNNEFIGEIIFLEGEIVDAGYQQVHSFKALMKLCVLTTDSEDYKIVVEPELIASEAKKIDIPLGNLKRKLNDYYQKYKDAEKMKPPRNMKLLAKPEVVEINIDISPEEYSVLCTLSDYSLVDDVYNNCELMDFEITAALVTLRKKEAIKVVKLV